MGFFWNWSTCPILTIRRAGGGQARSCHRTVGWPAKFDFEMQRQILSSVSPKAPALSIANPADQMGDLPAFIVAGKGLG